MSETTTITAQVPTDLRDKINEIAEAEHRSASGQIRLFLEACIADYKAGRFPHQSHQPRRVGRTA